MKKYIFWSFLFLFSIPVFAQVDTAWVRRYDESEYQGGDEARALAVDGSGNVYVTGRSHLKGTDFYWDYATIKYAPNGDTLWVRRYDKPEGYDNRDASGNAIAVDGNGNVYVTGSSYTGSSEYATIKYTPNGDTLWVRKYNGSIYNDAYALAVDHSGNVYVTGASGSYPNNKYATLKYSPDGDILWVRRYDEQVKSDGGGVALAVDDSGNVYVTGLNGSTLSFPYNYDYATIKYAPNGDTVWVRRYNGPGNDDDAARALAVDDSGNVYVTGPSHGSGTLADYATIKYASDGEVLWVKRYNGPTDNSDASNAIAVDDRGNVYVTGYSRGSGTSWDYATIKYAPNGDTLWVRRYNGPGNIIDEAKALVVDASGNVYVTGYSRGVGTSDEYATIKYAPNGDTLWVRRYNGPGNSFDRATALGVDDSGNVYVTGYSIGRFGDFDYATIKYNKFGCAARAGDVNSDYAVDFFDIILKVNYVFRGGAKPDPLCSGDDNADDLVNLADIIYSVNFVLKGGPAPLKSKECCL